MTGKLTAQAGTPHYRRTLVDRNRILKVTDRRFHAAWEELRGAKLWITETVAGECVRARDFSDLDAVRAEAARLATTQPVGSMAAMDAAQEVWWLDEWAAPEGIVGLRRLDERAMRARDALLARMVPEHFGCADADEVAELADARIVAETVVLKEELLLSSNFNRVDVDELNRWLRSHAQGVDANGSGPVHLVDGYVKECMEQSEAGRSLGIRATLAGFWPEDRKADDDEIIASALEASARMTKRRAHLNASGTYIAEHLSAAHWRGWIGQAISSLRKHGGERVQGAERRHPKHRAWERKRYIDNTPALAAALHETRRRFPNGTIGFKVTDAHRRYTITWSKGPGEGAVDVGTASGAAATAEALIICGVEPESQRSELVEALVRGREIEITRQKDGQI